MPSPKSLISHIAEHRVWVANVDAAARFYIEQFGAVAPEPDEFRTNKDCARLSFHWYEGVASGARETLLTLISANGREIRPQDTDGRKQGYWKFGVTLADVDRAHKCLVANGIEVSDAQQFLDVGYLCHLTDIDGHSIELLQHTFESNKKPSPTMTTLPLGQAAHLGQITLRVFDPKASLRFYVDQLGMRLLSRQSIEPYRFTLYFLAFTEEHPPHADIDAIANREWLWQRPYTVLELQHYWDVERDETRQEQNETLGFAGVHFASELAIGDLATSLRERDVAFDSTPPELIDQGATLTLRDPDGYTIGISPI